MVLSLQCLGLLFNATSVKFVNICFFPEKSAAKHSIKVQEGEGMSDLYVNFFLFHK